ncbi:MAG: hypothetical protein LBL74_03825 [Bacteroidales bacterium]|nr:hypothetical protein [Bacteroidales bacterium]
MIRKLRTIILMLALCASGSLLMISCGSSKQAFNTKILPSEISNIQVFDPFSVITLHKVFNADISDSISYSAQTMLKDVLMNPALPLPITSFISYADPNLNDRIANEIMVLTSDLAKYSSFDNLVIPYLLDSLLDASGRRFGLVAYQTGYKRNAANYTLSLIASFSIGLLTLGSYYWVPIGANSNISIAIVDAVNNNIAYYKSSFFSANPCNKKNITKQVNDIFEPLLNPKPKP